MSSYQLISFDLCPFVQRSVIALEEKGVPYEIEYIDLADKPDWFIEISPLGKVPLLKVEGEVLFESAVIAEFIDETADGARLHPESALARAKHRAWIEFLSTLYGDNYMLSMAQDRVRVVEIAETIRKKLARLEGELGDGPLFDGERFSLVDASAAPLFQRLTWCDELSGELHLFADKPRLSAWRDTLLAHPSVRASTKPEIKEIYLEYLNGRGSPSRKAEPAWLARQAA